METVLDITRASIFLILALFSSTALSVTVNSESGGASLDGAWNHGGCHLDDENEFGGKDNEEYLIFQDTTVEARIVLFATDDGSCGGVGSIGESEVFDFTVGGLVDGEFVEELQTQGWDGDQPMCQDPDNCTENDGLLADTPLASVHTILIPGEDDETKYWYIDDTALIWYLYFNAGEDEAPEPFMNPEEPLVKTDLALGVIPIPAGIWLFGTALIGIVGMSRRRNMS